MFTEDPLDKQAIQALCCDNDMQNIVILDWGFVLELLEAFSEQQSSSVCSSGCLLKLEMVVRGRVVTCYVFFFL